MSSHGYVKQRRRLQTARDLSKGGRDRRRADLVDLVGPIESPRGRPDYFGPTQYSQMLAYPSVVVLYGGEFQTKIGCTLKMADAPTTSKLNSIFSVRR